MPRTHPRTIRESSLETISNGGDRTIRPKCGGRKRGRGADQQWVAERQQMKKIGKKKSYAPSTISFTKDNLRGDSEKTSSSSRSSSLKTVQFRGSLPKLKPQRRSPQRKSSLARIREEHLRPKQPPPEMKCRKKIKTGSTRDQSKEEDMECIIGTKPSQPEGGDTILIETKSGTQSSGFKKTNVNSGHRGSNDDGEEQAQGEKKHKNEGNQSGHQEVSENDSEKQAQGERENTNEFNQSKSNGTQNTRRHRFKRLRRISEKERKPSQLEGMCHKRSSRRPRRYTPTPAVRRSPRKRKKSEPCTVNLISDDDEEQEKIRNGEISKRRVLPRRKAAAKSSKRRLPDATVVASYSPPNEPNNCIALVGDDVDRLKPGEYLNDSLIDFYMKWWFCQECEKAASERCHAFSSFFFTKLRNSRRDPEKLWQMMRSWTRRVNIFEKDYLFIPINERLHWTLMVVCFPGRAAEEAQQRTRCPGRRRNSGRTNQSLNADQNNPIILYFDSLGSRGGKKHGTFMREYLTQAYKAKHNFATAKSIDRSSNLESTKNGRTFKIIADDLPMKNIKVPQQDNTCDCGVYVLHFAELFSSTPFDGSDVNRTDWFNKEAIKAKRREIKKLIERIGEENKKEAATKQKTKRTGNADAQKIRSSIQEKRLETKTSQEQKTDDEKALAPHTRANVLGDSEMKEAPKANISRGFGCDSNTPEQTGTKDSIQEITDVCTEEMEEKRNDRETEAKGDLREARHPSEDPTPPTPPTVSSAFEAENPKMEKQDQHQISEEQVSPSETKILKNVSDENLMEMSAPRSCNELDRRQSGTVELDSRQSVTCDELVLSSDEGDKNVETVPKSDALADVQNNEHNTAGGNEEKGNKPDEASSKSSDQENENIGATVETFRSESSTDMENQTLKEALNARTPAQPSSPSQAKACGGKGELINLIDEQD